MQKDKKYLKNQILFSFFDKNRGQKNEFADIFKNKESEGFY